MNLLKADRSNMGSEKPGSDNGEKRVYQDKEEMKLWGIFIFALIGATATTFAVSSLAFFGFYTIWVCNLFILFLVKL